MFSFVKEYRTLERFSTSVSADLNQYKEYTILRTIMYYLYWRRFSCRGRNSRQSLEIRCSPTNQNNCLIILYVLLEAHIKKGYALYPNLAAYGKLSSTKLMYNNLSATQNANMETYHVTMTIIHELNLESIFMTAMFKDKVPFSNYLPVDRATHENTPQTWWSVD